MIWKGRFSLLAAASVRESRARLFHSFQHLPPTRTVDGHATASTLNKAQRALFVLDAQFLGRPLNLPDEVLPVAIHAPLSAIVGNPNPSYA